MPNEDEKRPALYHKKLETPWGGFFLAATATGVTAVGLPVGGESAFFRRLAAAYEGFLFLPGTTPEMEQAEAYIPAYLAGDERRPSTVPFHIRVSPWQFQVLEAISAIPYGRTRTYGELATAIGKPGGARAVGAACRANPLPILIPCHRVVAAEGLGGYGGAWGDDADELAFKKRLLEHEAAHLDR